MAWHDMKKAFRGGWTGTEPSGMEFYGWLGAASVGLRASGWHLGLKINGTEPLVAIMDTTQLDDKNHDGFGWKRKTKIGELPVVHQAAGKYQHMLISTAGVPPLPKPTLFRHPHRPLGETA
jgi:hypothetical protein